MTMMRLRVLAAVGVLALVPMAPHAAQPAAGTIEVPATAAAARPGQAAANEARSLAAQGDLAAALDAWDAALRASPQAWDWTVERGGARLLSGDTAGAEQDFMRALSAAHEDSQLPDLVGQAYLAAGHAGTAAAYFRRALGLSPLPEYRLHLARALAATDDWDGAQVELDLALEAQPDDPDLLLSAADLARAAGDPAAGLEYLRRAVAVATSPAPWIALATLLSETDSPDAEAVWDKLTADWPDSTDVWLARAEDHRRRGMHSAALADLEHAQQAAPQDPRVPDLWAEVLLAGGDNVGAIAQRRRAAQLEPTARRYLDLLALLAAEPTRAAELGQTWADFLAAFPDHPEALLADGDRLYAAGSFEAAAQAFARGAAAAPQDPRFPAREGDCRYSLGEFQAAAALYERSLALGFDAQVTANLAGALVAVGRIEDAEQLWQDSIADHPDDAELAMQYGLALTDDEQYEAALNQFQRGQWLAPHSDAFFNRAGLCLFRLGRTAEAVDQAEQALRLRPDPLYYLNAASGYETLDQPEEARRTYRAGLAQFPQSIELLSAYAELLERQGDRPGAIETWRAIAELEPSAEVYAQLGALARGAGDLSQAETSYLRALDLAPDAAWLHAEYALLLAEQWRADALLYELENAHQRLSPQDFDWVVDELAAWWMDSGEYQRGVQVMESVIRLDPRRPTAYNGLAMLQQLQGESATALATVKRGLNDAGDNYLGRYLEVMLTSLLYGGEAALTLAPALLTHPQADADAYLLYLDLLGAGTDYARQIDIARRGLEFDPGSVELLAYLATALYSSGQTAEVVKLLTDRRYVRLDFAARDELLGLSYLDEGNYVRAAGHLTSAAQADALNAGLWAALGEAQYLAGQLEEARSALVRALALDPDDPRPQIWLGFVLLDQGDLNGAAASLDAAAEAEYASVEVTAWLALGRARLAIGRGDLAGATLLLDEAAGYQLAMPRFSERLAAARAELRR